MELTGPKAPLLVKATKDDSRIHPAWRALMEYCRNLQHGEIEKLRIQDGLPVIAEVITRKVKFTK